MLPSLRSPLHHRPSQRALAAASTLHEYRVPSLKDDEDAFSAPLQHLHADTDALEAMVYPSLTISQRRQVTNLLTAYPLMHETETQLPGQATSVTHRIDTGTEQHVHQRHYGVSSTERRAILGEIDKMLVKKIIQPSCSLSSSSVVLVKKKAGS